jgi:hypothetical protein
VICLIPKLSLQAPHACIWNGKNGIEASDDCPVAGTINEIQTAIQQQEADANADEIAEAKITFANFAVERDKGIAHCHRLAALGVLEAHPGAAYLMTAKEFDLFAENLKHASGERIQAVRALKVPVQKVPLQIVEPPKPEPKPTERYFLLQPIMFDGQRPTPRFAFVDLDLAEASYAKANRLALTPDDPRVQESRKNMVMQQRPEPHQCWDVIRHQPPTGHMEKSLPLPQYQLPPNYAPTDRVADTRLPREPIAAAGRTEPKQNGIFEERFGKPYTTIIDKPGRIDDQEKKS